MQHQVQENAQKHRSDSFEKNVDPHPFPELVAHFQSVISLEARSQMLELTGKLPDYVVACVGYQYCTGTSRRNRAYLPFWSW